MLPTEPEKLSPINEEEISNEIKELVEKPLEDEILIGNSKTIFESIDKLYLFDKNTEDFYSNLASKLLISLFIVDFTRKLNNNLNKKYDLKPLDISAVLDDNSFKRYYKDQVEDLEKDKLISWFIHKGLPVLDDCLNKKQYTKLKDVINVDINMDLLKEYLGRIEDDFDFYEILTQFKNAFEKYPQISRFTIKTTKIEIEGFVHPQEIHSLRGVKYQDISNLVVDKTEWH